jgi:hypothetical protein
MVHLLGVCHSNSKRLTNYNTSENLWGLCPLSYKQNHSVNSKIRQMKVHTVTETILMWVDNTKSLVVSFWLHYIFQTLNPYILQLNSFIGSLQFLFYSCSSLPLFCPLSWSSLLLHSHITPHLWASLDNTSLPKQLCHFRFTALSSLPGLTPRTGNSAPTPSVHTD